MPSFTCLRTEGPRGEDGPDGARSRPPTTRFDVLRLLPAVFPSTPCSRFRWSPSESAVNGLPSFVAVAPHSGQLRSSSATGDLDSSDRTMRRTLDFGWKDDPGAGIERLSLHDRDAPVMEDDLPPRSEQTRLSAARGTRRLRQSCVDHRLQLTAHRSHAGDDRRPTVPMPAGVLDRPGLRHRQQVFCKIVDGAPELECPPGEAFPVVSVR